MAHVVWPATFPLGVADTDAGLALFKAADDLIVLRLADGAILWREPMGDARPLLVGRGLAVVSRADEVLAYSVREDDRGALHWRFPLPTLPTEAEAAWIDDEIGVHWQSLERYRGGAHPGTRTASSAQSGLSRVDPVSGAARALAGWPERGHPPQWEASDDPSVLAACVLDGVRYQAASQSTGLRLTATRTSDGGAVWDVPLGAHPPRPAPRLRP